MSCTSSDPPEVHVRAALMYDRLGMLRFELKSSHFNLVAPESGDRIATPGTYQLVVHEGDPTQVCDGTP